VIEKVLFLGAKKKRAKMFLIKNFKSKPPNFLSLNGKKAKISERFSLSQDNKKKSEIKFLQPSFSSYNLFTFFFFHSITKLDYLFIVPPHSANNQIVTNSL